MDTTMLRPGDVKTGASEAGAGSANAGVPLQYLSGFGVDLKSEALPDTVPVGQNCALRPAYGLYHELVSAASFTAPRAQNRRVHFYRIRPSVVLGEMKARDCGLFVSAPLTTPAEPNAIGWDPVEISSKPHDFLDGIVTLCANGSAEGQSGMAMHVYTANRSMEDKVFSNGDGEMLIIPEQGGLRLVTELGILEVQPSDLAIIPRGCKVRVELLDNEARGWVCENYGIPFQLPELGLIGSQGQANGWDFEAPVAAFEDREVDTLLVHKLAGRMYEAVMGHSPFDVVGWRGNYYPVKYDMQKFMVLGAVSFDHSDPSIYCALTSPSDSIMGPTADFMIMPPRWLVAQNTFRPAAFHRNAVSEFLAVVWDRTKGNATKLKSGSSTLHNAWAPHGPDADLVEYGRNQPQVPERYERLFFMFESRYPFALTDAGRNAPERLKKYLDNWKGFRNQFRENGPR